MAAGTRRAKESVVASSTKSSDSIKDDKKKSKGDAEASKTDTTSESKENAQQPLGPPPKPSQGNDGDYFNNTHGTNNNHPYQSEPNPFEAQFGQPSSDTPGKLGLPPVAALTSPSSLMPGDTPGWNSLRSGPLSPAMLAGPTSDYFDSSYSRSFPTPNESGLRTGLTPGGGGSMFPAPSPNSQAIFNSLQLGANTPNTLEFLRTGLSVKAATNGQAPTSQPTSDAQTRSQSMELKMPTAQPSTSDPYNNHPDADAANGLFMLANANNARDRPGSQFAVPSQPSTSQAGSSSMANAVQPPPSQPRSQKGSVASSAHQNGATSGSDSEQEAKPATRSRGKKPAEPKAAGNRRKAADTPTKTPASKKQKTAAPVEKLEPMSPDDEDDDDDEEMPTHHKDGKKMTDEEKRKNFLERNRVAALKCRQRKKQWLANLQNKCDLYSQENDALTHTVNQQREQILQLKQLLIQHKDCPVTMQQGISPQAFTNFLNHDVQIIPFMSGNGVNGSVQGVPMMVDGRQGPNGQMLQRS